MQRWLLLLFLAASCGDDSATPARSDAGDASALVDAGGGGSDAGTDASTEPPPEVSTALGTVRGTRGTGFQAFLGIPYAAPPVGDLRWRAPRPAAAWDGVLDATTKRSACVQNAFGVATGDEDCLFLNVHTPDPRPERAPVMVWIHGGAFIFGEGLQIDGGTAGDILAQRHGLVVVSMNYRLGPFGFLASAALGSSGNQGIEDQQLALRWVHDHIADFGGDPSNVTIAGESAGGFSVCMHLVAPASRGLFARAISESGLCDSALLSHEEQLSTSANLTTALGCDAAPDAAACLRGKSADDVQGVATGSLADLLTREGRSFRPGVDGTVIPAGFRDSVSSGAAADVPAIFGWNRDEGTLFVGLAEQDGTVVDEAAYHTAAATFAMAAGVAPSAVEAAYPLSAYPDPGAAVAAILGHFALACPSRRAARLFADHGSPVHVYHFEYPNAGFQLDLGRPLGAYHSAEIQFVFGHPSMIGRRRFAGDEVALNDAVSAYWARFVTNGDPGGDGAVAWPLYTTETEDALVLDTTIAPTTAPDRDACALWDGTGP